jgi:hypothetical protein
MVFRKNILDSNFIDFSSIYLVEDERYSKCKKGNSIYTECRRIPGIFRGMYSNCKQDKKGWKYNIREDNRKTKLDRDKELEIVERPPSCRQLYQKGVINKDRIYTQQKYSK